jgi:uncharacterized protein with PIN domain
MALSADKISLLLKMLRDTQEVELTCPECLAELDKYAQSTLDDQPVEGLLQRIREHLNACPACEDEFKVIVETLKAMEE